MALKWYTSYLAERTQTFQVGTDKSKTFAVNCRVPHGSVLGALKFIAYIENLLYLKNAMWTLIFTQSTAISTIIFFLSNVGAAIPKLENSKDAVHKWCASKHLQLNTAKKEVISFDINANLKKLQSVDLVFVLELTPSRLLWLCVTLA